MVKGNNNDPGLCTAHSSFKCGHNIFTYTIAFLVVLLSVYVVEYTYLTSLYLVDEVYEVGIPREITIEEKITLRTVAAENSAAIKNFVETYSICQSVYEIQVLFPLGKDAPIPTSPPKFVYTKTHSKVHVDYIQEHRGDMYHMMLYHNKRVDTDGKRISLVMLYLVRCGSFAVLFHNCSRHDAGC